MDWMEKSASLRKEKWRLRLQGNRNLANKFVSELAGKIVLVVEGSKLKAAKFPGRGVPGQADGFHTLYQNKKGKPLPDVLDGLCMCGEFASSTDLEKIVAKQATNYSMHDQHRTHADNKVHLYCLYWTSTGGNIQENTRQMAANFQLVRDMVAKQNSGTVKHLPGKWHSASQYEGVVRRDRRGDRARNKYAGLFVLVAQHHSL